MVLKRAKKGVYSGNTLRASDSRFNTLYRASSSIVRRFVNNTEQTTPPVKQLVDNYDLSAFDVEFSLNKKSRWDLPEEIRNHIQNMDVDDETLKTDMLVRHKLKRQANCVAYYANKGLLKRLVPKTGRYFDGKTATEFKRRPSRKARRAMRGAEEEKGDVTPKENTIRYEITIPCSPYSSIVHNPKYIKPELDPEAESATFGSGRKKKKRTRLTSRDIDEILEYSDPRDDFLNYGECNIEESEKGDVKPSTSFTLRDFIKPDRKPKHKSHRHQCRVSDENESKKPGRLVYIELNPNDPEQIFHTQKSESVEMTPNEPTRVHAVAVKLRNEDVAFDILQETYGTKYIEAKCEPRRFCIDITEKLCEHVRRSQYFRDIVPSSLDLTCFLSFTELRTCPFDPSLCVFNVALNLATNMESVKLENVLELQECSIRHIEERAFAYVDMLPRDVFLKRNITNMYCKPIMDFELVTKAKKWNVNCFHPEEKSIDSLRKEKADSELINCEYPADHCSICFDEISTDPLTGSILAAATCLTACGHWFCNRCWRDHLVSQLRRGAPHFACPEYKCTATVDLATLLSFLHVSDLHKHAVRQQGEKINCSPQAVWCPLPKCGRAILAEGSKNMPPRSAVCHCGLDLCFSCMKNAHWPATCEQAKRFRDKVIAFNDFTKLPNDSFIDPLPLSILVHGKSCPKCKRFIEKISGCPNMSCPCGTTFCWTCLKAIAPYGQHDCSKVGLREMVMSDERVIEGIDRTGLRKTEFYATALEHRQMRMYTRFCKFRSRAVSMSRSLAAMAKDSTVQKQISRLEADNRSVRSRLCKFLVHVVGIKLELHHVTEHVAIAMDNMSASGLRQKLQGCVTNMESYISGIESVLECTSPQDLRYVIIRLQDIEHNAQKTVLHIARLL